MMPADAGFSHGVSSHHRRVRAQNWLGQANAGEEDVFRRRNQARSSAAENRVCARVHSSDELDPGRRRGSVVRFAEVVLDRAVPDIKIVVSVICPRLQHSTRAKHRARWTAAHAQVGHRGVRQQVSTASALSRERLPTTGSLRAGCAVRCRTTASITGGQTPLPSILIWSLRVPCSNL